MMEVSRNLRQANKLPVPRSLLIRLVRFSRFPPRTSSPSTQVFLCVAPHSLAHSTHSVHFGRHSAHFQSTRSIWRVVVCRPPKRLHESHKALEREPLFFLLLLSKEWRAFLSACLSHLDLLSQNDERGRYSVMGQFPDQLRCNKQISNGPRGQRRMSYNQLTGL